MAQSLAINSCTVGSDQLCCFDKLSKKEMDIINANSVVAKYSAGENICKQGTFASHIMVIEEGLVKAYLEGNNETLILKILPAVNMLGLSSLIEGNSVFQYSAQAYLPTTLRLIEINEFKGIMEKNGKFATKIVSLLGANVAITYGRFFCLTKKQTYGRLADILLCLAQRIYKNDKFPLQLTRKDLGELSSMSIESIARILTKFKEDKLIKITNDSIEILDLERLTMISNNG